MGHRTNLIVRTETEDKYLFETNNSLAFFWIALFDREIIESCRDAWQYYDKLIEQDDEEELERYTDDMPSPLWFYISKEQFDHNRKVASDYLKKCYPEALNLFTEFCNYIETQYNGEIDSDEFIMLDIIAISGFYDTAGEFMNELLIEIKKLKTFGQTNYLNTSDLIASGTGFACAGFEQISTTYQVAFRKRNTMFSRPQKEKSNNADFSWKLLIFWLLMLLACPLFSFITYRGYLKEGFSFYVVSFGLCNIGFYILSGWILLEQIRTLIKSKKKK